MFSVFFLQPVILKNQLIFTIFAYAVVLNVQVSVTNALLNFSL